MIRRDSSRGNDFRTVVSSDCKESKLEAKKRRVQESSIKPEVRRFDDLSKSQKERLNGSYTPNDEDEKPTGYLDEDDEVSQEETPTGYLEEDDNESKSLPKLKVTKVTGRGETVKKETGYSDGEFVKREEKEPVSINKSSINNKVRNIDNRQVHREVKGRRVNERQTVSKQENKGRIGFTDENVSVDRSNNVNDFEYAPPSNRSEKMPEKEGRRKGNGRVVFFLLLFVLLMVISVCALVIVKYVNNNENISGNVGSTFTGDAYTELVNEVNFLYTDSNKCDIKETVTDSDIQNVVGLLGVYKESASYVESNYELISQEIGTISFYLQDREIYNELASGLYQVGSKEYDDNFSTVENDIYLYTVSGLAGTMRTKLEILKTTNGVIGTQNKEVNNSIESETSVSLENTTEQSIVILNSNQVVDLEEEGDVVNEGIIESTPESESNRENVITEDTEKIVSSEEVIGSQEVENKEVDMGTVVSGVLNAISKDTN